MPLTIAQRLDRLKVRIAELAHWRDRQSAVIDGWTFEGEPIALQQDWPHRQGWCILPRPLKRRRRGLSQTFACSSISAARA